MAHDAKNHLSFDGNCSDFFQFSVRSRSRGDLDEPLRHTVAICKRTGFISCTCEDAQFRCKTARITDHHAPLCWHARQAKRWCQQVLGKQFGDRSHLREDD